MCEEPVADGKLGKKTIARRKARHRRTETERRCEAAARRNERTKTGSKTCQGHIRPEGGTSSALGLHHTMTTQYWKQPILVNTFLLLSSTRSTAALATDGSVSSSETIKTWAVSVAQVLMVSEVTGSQHDKPDVHCVPNNRTTRINLELGVYEYRQAGHTSVSVCACYQDLKQNKSITERPLGGLSQLRRLVWQALA